MAKAQNPVLSAIALAAALALSACGQRGEDRHQPVRTRAQRTSAKGENLQLKNSAGCLDLAQVVEKMKKNTDALVRIHSKNLGLYQPSSTFQNLIPVEDRSKVAAVLKLNGDFRVSLESKRVGDLLKSELFSVVAQDGCKSVTFQAPGTDRKVEFSILTTPNETKPSRGKSSAIKRPATSSILVLESVSERKEWRVYQIAGENNMTVQTIDPIENVEVCGGKASFLARTMLDVAFSSAALREPLTIGESLAEVLLKHTPASNNLKLELALRKGEKSSMPARGRESVAVRISESELTDAIRQIKAGKIENIDCAVGTKGKN